MAHKFSVSIKLGLILFICIERISCSLIQVRNEDFQVRNVAGCMGNCHYNSQPNSELKACYNYCSDNFIVRNITKLKWHRLDVRIICRDAYFLLLDIHVEKHVRDNINNEKFMYVVNMKDTNSRYVNADQNTQVFITNTSIVKLENLSPSKQFNITVDIVNLNYEYLTVSGQFRTLPHNFKPEVIPNFTVQTYENGSFSRAFVDAVITWPPTHDYTCGFDIFVVTKEKDYFRDYPIKIRHSNDFYRFRIDQLKYNAEYSIAIRGINTQNSSLEGPLIWNTIKTPSCDEWYKSDNTLCDPLPPFIISTQEYLVASRTYDIDVLWDLPKIIPEYYTVKILHLSPDSNDHRSYSKNTSGNANGISFESIELTGIHYQVYVTVFNHDRSAFTSIVTQYNHQPRSYLENFCKKLQRFVDTYKHMMPMLLSFVLLVIVMSLMCCKMRASFKREPDVTIIKYKQRPHSLSCYTYLKRGLKMLKIMFGGDRSFYILK